MVEERFWAKVLKTDACWLWTGKRAHDGYGYFRIKYPQHDVTTAAAHRVAWTLTVGPIPPGFFVCHHCDVRYCVNPAHLFLGTHKDNMRDATVKGRVNRGEKNGQSKLTNDQVQQIRTLEGTHTEIATKFGVTPETISFIRNYKGWKHVS